MDNNRKGKPGHSETAAAWQTAIGLQAADGLSASEYIWQVSRKHISGSISLEQVKESLNQYYLDRNAHDAGDPEKEEADKVSANIAGILLSDSFDFSTEGLLSLHRQIFEGVYENAGALRDRDVSIREWVLGGDSVSFMSVENLRTSLEYAIEKERNYQYEMASPEKIITHLAGFMAGLWQICPFNDGNSRVIAVFTILYLRSLGFEFDNEVFANYAWYLHNALVRANYRDIAKHIDYAPIYLERFFRNLLLGEKWDLRNRYVHVRPAAEWSVQPNRNSSASAGQVSIKKETKKKQEKPAEKHEPEKPAEPPKTKVKEPVVEDDCSDNPNVLFLVVTLGDKFLSVKEIMDGLHLKGRDSFLKLYLAPAVNGGLVSPLYPKAPRHPRQKYLLTAKGLAFLKSIGPEMTARIQQHLASR